MDNSEVSLNDTSCHEVSTMSENGEVFDIHFSQKELREILTEKMYRQSSKRNRSKTREYKIFVKWQLEMTKKLWNERRLACGFMYERGRVFENAVSIKGKYSLILTVEMEII